MIDVGLVSNDKVKYSSLLPSRLVVGRLPLEEDILGSSPSSATIKLRLSLVESFCFYMD